MEILITTTAVLTLLVIFILIGTGGKPMKFITAFGDTLRAIGRNRRPLFYMALAAGFALAFLYLFYVYPSAGIGPAQPIPFSHRVHSGVKQIDCRFCHPYVERSTFPGLPPVQKCLFCHDYIIAKHPEILKEHNYFNTETPTPWRKVTYMPEHVMFNHKRHIKKDIDCQACHGIVEAQDRLADPHLKMGFCLECHRQRNANIGCWLACHN